MPRGASPGERRGGRAVGTPNKFGEQRAVAVEREGKRLPAANLLIIVENSMAMAARYQPGRADAPNPEHNEERYAFWLNRAREALSGGRAGFSSVLLPTRHIKLVMDAI